MNIDWVPISLFAMILGIVYLIVRKKERLALIEKGVDTSLFKEKESKSIVLKYGMFFVSIALGILGGYFIAEYTSLLEEVAYFSAIFLFGGLSLIIFYFVDK